MHPTSTHHEFLALRVQGLSFAAIARRLGVSKPTLIAWSQKSKPLLAARIAQEQQRALNDLGHALNHQLADLTRRHNFLKQELLSRAFQNIPTPDIQAMADQYNQKIQNLNRTLAPASERQSTPD